MVVYFFLAGAQRWDTSQFHVKLSTDVDTRTVFDPFYWLDNDWTYTQMHTNMQPDSSHTSCLYTSSKQPYYLCFRPSTLMKSQTQARIIARI
jgi:hypothetical protein